MRPARWAAGGLTAALAVLLLGCSSPETPGAPAPSATAADASSTSASATPGTPTTAPSGTPTAAASSSVPSGTPSVVPRRPVQTASPRALDRPSRTADAEVALTSVQARTITAEGPGDTSGPGVLVRLRVRNTTGRALDTSLVQVNVANASGAPGSLVNGAPTDPLGSSLGAGRSASATYAFLLPDAKAGAVTVLVQVSAGQPVLQFRGRVTSS